MADHTPRAFDPTYPLSGTLVRGGTSKCWLFYRDAMPSTRDEIDQVLIDVIGARDARQIDGVGGGTSTTSKIAIVDASHDEFIDIDYEFGQVGIGAPVVEWYSDCGNCATAIALFAVEEQLVPVRGDVTRVVMRNINTDTVIECDVDTPDGRVDAAGSAEVPGVTGTGVGVRIIFRFPEKSHLGEETLPTSQPIDVLQVSGKPLHATLLVAGAPVAIFDAADLGRTARESLGEVREMISFFTEARQVAAQAMGSAITSSPGAKSIPKVGMVGGPEDYATATGAMIRKEEYDLSLRMISMDDPHPSIGLTTAAAIGVSSVVEGTLIARALPDTARSGSAGIRVGTANGVVPVRVVERESQEGRVTEVELTRAARILGRASIAVRSGVPRSRA